MRKAIQIAAAPETENDFDVCCALCDDGTIWYMTKPTYSKDEREWIQLPPIPNTDS